MNTHDIDIELPPLPKFDRLSSMHPDDVAKRLRNYGRKCARAAIEADRKRRDVPVPKGWKLVPETPTSKQIVHMACQIKGADADGWFRTDGDDWPEHVDAAERAYKWALSEAPQLAERDVDQVGEYRADLVVPLYTTPQPVESCASLMSDKPVCGSENGDCDSQPAEPVKGPSDDVLADADRATALLTIFASTDNAGIAMIDVDYSWLQKAEEMIKFSCANKVNITIPTYFWLEGDDDYESNCHEAIINPGPQWNPETATIQFAAYEHDESNERLMTAEIGLSELRQAFDLGMRELCIDFGTETLTVEDAIRAFNLVRDQGGTLIQAPRAALRSCPGSN